MASKLITSLSSFAMSSFRSPIKQKLPSHLTFLQHYCTASPIGSLNLDQKHKRLVVKWKESEKLDEYPLVWLRDNCQCSKCFNAAAKSRTIDFGAFSLHSKPVKAVSFKNIPLNL